VLKIGLVVIAATLAGCATTRQERADAFRQALPQLVSACNEAFSDDPLTRDGINACARLATKGSLGLANPEAASAYVRYAGDRWQGRVGADTAGAHTPYIPTLSQ